MENLFTNENLIVDSNRILYTPSAFAKDALLYLQEIGYLKAKEKHTSRRANLDSYLFFIVEEGSGVVTYGRKKYKVKAGDCVFLDCRKTYSHTTDEDNLWKLRWIHFNGTTAKSIYEKYLDRGGEVVFSPKELGIIINIHNSLLATAGADDYIRDMKINALIGELLVMIMEGSVVYDRPTTGKSRKDVEPIRDYLDEHFREKISLDELADKFFINKFYMTRIFKEQYGTSINSYITGLKITQAKELLRFSDDSLEMIGEKCGIGDANYFSRTFKKVEGISPREYRKIWNNLK